MQYDEAAERERLLKWIENKGVMYYRVGESITLVLPADQLFEQNSPVFKSAFYPILDKVAQLLKPVQKIGIKITAYTDNQGSLQRQQSLSKEWADSLARYLWDRGIDTRFLYAVGLGGCDSVADNDTWRGRAANRRIEITFQEIP